MAEKSEKKSVVVTSPLVQATDARGIPHHLNAGSSLEGFPAEEVQRLVDGGFAGEPDVNFVPGVGVAPPASR